MADINGIPYVEATDLVSAYPGTSLALATELDTQLGSKLDLAGGKILQVVQETKTDVFSESVAAGGVSGDTISASITPQNATSKVLVLATAAIANSGTSGNVSSFVYLFRNGSASDFRGDAAGSRSRAISGQLTNLTTARLPVNVSFNYVDAPNSVVSTTYSIRLGHQSGSTQTVYLNRSDADTDSNTAMRGASSIILMEVSS
jgi:hypothetical protein